MCVMLSYPFSYSVFRFGHLIPLHLRLLLLGTYSLPFFHTCVPLSPTAFLPVLKAVSSIYCRAGLVEVYSCRLLLSGKLLTWLSVLLESLGGLSSLGCRPLVLITWNIFCHSFLAWSVSIEKSAANLIGAPLYVTSCFSLSAFKILSLSWNFAILIMMYLMVGLFGSCCLVLSVFPGFV